MRPLIAKLLILAAIVLFGVAFLADFISGFSAPHWVVDAGGLAGFLGVFLGM